MKTCGNMGTWEHRAILEGNKGTRTPPPLGGPPNYPKEIEKECVAKSPSVYIYIVIQTS